MNSLEFLAIKPVYASNGVLQYSATLPTALEGLITPMEWARAAQMVNDYMGTIQEHRPRGFVFFIAFGICAVSIVLAFTVGLEYLSLFAVGVGIAVVWAFLNICRTSVAIGNMQQRHDSCLAHLNQEIFGGSLLHLGIQSRGYAFGRKSRRWEPELGINLQWLRQLKGKTDVTGTCNQFWVRGTHCCTLAFPPHVATVVWGRGCFFQAYAMPTSGGSNDDGEESLREPLLASTAATFPLPPPLRSVSAIPPADNKVILTLLLEPDTFSSLLSLTLDIGVPSVFWSTDR